jgi:hypothetical protein
VSEEALDPVIRAALMGATSGGPTEAQRRRMAERLSVAVGVPVGDLLGSGSGSGSGNGSGSGSGSGGGSGGGGGVAGGLSTKAKLGIVAMVAAAGAGGYALRGVREEPPAVVATAPVMDAAIVPDAVMDAVMDAPVTVDAVRKPRVDADDRAALLARERQLLDVARSAIKRGEHRLAMRNLAEHDLRFPDGALAEEAAVLWIEVDVARGEAASAAKRAAAFRAAYPGSIFTARVDALVP